MSRNDEAQGSGSGGSEPEDKSRPGRSGRHTERGPRLEGWLSKWSGMVKGWQPRWITVDATDSSIKYYSARPRGSASTTSFKASIPLSQASVRVDNSNLAAFTVSSPTKSLYFQTNSVQERDEWVKGIASAISRARLSSPPLATSEELDRRFSETSALLNLLREGTNDLAKRSSADSKSLDNIQGVWTKSALMVEQVQEAMEAIKHAQSLIFPHGQQTEEDDVHRPPPNFFPPEDEFSSSEDEPYYDAFERWDERPSVTSIDPTQIPTASENTKDNLSIPPPPKTGEDSETQEPLQLPASSVPSKYLRADGSIDYDSIYEDSYYEQVPTTQHTSVFTELLSQVRIGMDLSKVILPSFILEQRSLLEMYADHFSHPDLFVVIPSLPTPKERMIAVLKWYLSSFHAGRSSGIAKKPYNPILGEVFQCYWDLDDKGTEEAEDQPDPNRPLSWTNDSNLIFIAEQVSHHPPISAFYAEHPKSKISSCAHIWTKSKFLGLSVGVFNIGRGFITLHDHNETYEVTFPNGYGRSIFTVPWIELGGTVNISCRQTKFRATIEFLTKPVYSNKKHKITGTLWGPEKNTFKTLLNISGEWNGVVYLEWPNGKTEVLANVPQLKLYKKKVRKIHEQEYFESRQVWKHVTAGLRCNEISFASRSKEYIENQQREIARARSLEGVTWTPRHYLLEGEDWVFTNPLERRLPTVSAPRAVENTTSNKVDPK